MAKMWAGRSEKETAPIADDFNTSIHFACRMYRQDIMGSMAHAAMLGHCGILTPTAAAALQDGLAGILSDLDEGTLTIDPAAEDIHMFVEQTLTERLGDVGKKLHTARSRNDQVALDLRLYLLDEVREIRALTLGEGELFLMGDNRNRSSDSRDERLGAVDARRIIGKAVLLVFPGKDSLTDKRDFSRLGSLKMK